ncbi:Fic family protein [Staphylococcus massiliensis]|uniref:Fic family protein n=1 Tax=Staphylococcus massiliensis TaxID=555791 RepID=UPI001EDC9475|nr:Fic family protein [Staphylococcus massiliensis]MCG3399551.1 Fic family protein [Staphylococcus massiliensis]
MNEFLVPKPFEPQRLPIDSSIYINDYETLVRLTKANRYLGEYKGFLSTLINPILLISPLINQEAVLSSKLEGTHATLEDVLNYDAGIVVDIERDEMREVVNYRKALFYAMDVLGTFYEDDPQKLPLTGRIIKDMHRILLEGARGNSKRKGIYKVYQNYIGGKSSVSFTPVSPQLTDDYMQNLEDYIHKEDFDVLIQSAIIHAQFEMIHPFEDGNGRIGRLLIPLFLYYREILPFPTLYMSMYFENDRALYLDKLSRVSQKNDWIGWIKYYLEGIIAQTEYSIQVAKEIYALYEFMKNKVINQLNSANSIKLLNFIFESPVFNAKQASKASQLSIRSIYTLLNKMEKLGYIKSTDKKRNKIYYCPQLLEIIQI